MAVTQFLAAPYSGAAAGGTEIRAWVQAVHDALEDIGMVQTADAGQVDIGSMTNPATSRGAGAGYEVWRFDDALQAEAPIFFRVDYGRGGSGNNVSAFPTPAIGLTVGKGTDGAGAITEALHPLQWSSYTGTSGTNAHSTVATPGFASSGADGAMCAVFPFAGAALVDQGPAFFIERSRDRDGNATPEGVFVGQPVTASNLFAGAWVVNYETRTVVEHGPVAVMPHAIAGQPLAAGSLLGGTIAPLFPTVAYAPGVAPWQVRGLVAFPPGDAPSGEFDARLAGVTRTYRALPATSIRGWVRSLGVGSSHSSLNGCIAIEWE